MIQRRLVGNAHRLSFDQPRYYDLRAAVYYKKCAKFCEMCKMPSPKFYERFLAALGMTVGCGRVGGRLQRADYGIVTGAAVLIQSR
jgi:hypothetical protein